MAHIRLLLIPIVLVILAITGTISIVNAQSGPDLGQLAVYWLDSSGQRDHPDANANLLQPQYCTGTLPFFVYIHGDTDHDLIDDWEADIRVFRGVRGNISHSFRNRPGSSGVMEMIGRLTLDGDMSLSLRVRGRVDGVWGPWSRWSGLYCITTPAVARITTPVPQTALNEGDTHTFEVRFDRPMQLDTQLNLALRRENGSYPKFRGWPADDHKTITVRRGQSSVDVELQSLDDDIVAYDKKVYLDVVPGVGYELGRRPSSHFEIRNGSYVPERNQQGDLTGRTVFDPHADTVTITWPRCGSASIVHNSQTVPAGSFVVDEDAGTARIPITIIQGGVDYAFTRNVSNLEGTAKRDKDYRNLAPVLVIEPGVNPTYVEWPIIDSDQLEEAEIFRGYIFDSGSTPEFKIECEFVVITIEDDDTGNFSIDGDNQRTVAEGGEISFTVRLDGDTGNCKVPFPATVTFTPSGHTNALTSSDRVAKELYLPACTRSKTVKFSGLATSGDQGARQVRFGITLAPSSLADRITLDGRASKSVRYSVTIEDTQSGSTNQNVPMDAGNPPPAKKPKPAPTQTPTPTPTAESTPVPDPFTASIHDMPAGHDGSSFTFELRLSEKPKRRFSYKTIRDHAFEIQGGEVTATSRIIKRKNLLWNVTVTPDGNGNVTITLPPTVDCGAQGAICTDDGRMLSNRLRLVVNGPSQ